MASSTVRPGNRRASWKDRPSPARARWSGPAPVTSAVPSTIRPWSGGRYPERRSNSVVLPAPLGPMMPRISPATTSMLTSRTAWLPPNPTETASVRRRTSRAVSPVGPDGRSVRRRAVGRRCTGEEDRAEQVGATAELGGRPVEPHLALLEEDRSVGDGERHVGGLLDEQDRRAGLARGAEQGQEVADDQGGEARATARRRAAGGDERAAPWRAPAVAAGRRRGCRPARRGDPPTPGTARARPRSPRGARGGPCAAARRRSGGSPRRRGWRRSRLRPASGARRRPRSRGLARA